MSEQDVPGGPMISAKYFRLSFLIAVLAMLSGCQIASGGHEHHIFIHGHSVKNQMKKSAF